MTAPIPECHRAGRSCATVAAMLAALTHPDRSTRTEEPMSETEPAPTTGCHYPDTFAGRLSAYSDAWRNHAPDDDVIGEGPDAREPLLLRSDLDAALTEIVQLDRKLDNLRFELNARTDAESVDAAAGSYAERAEEAEAAATHLRGEVRVLTGECESLRGTLDRIRGELHAEKAHAENAVAILHAELNHMHERNREWRARAEQAEAALAELRGWYDEDAAMLQRILEAHDEDEAHDWIPDNLSRTVSEMRKSMRDRLFQREDDAILERAADEQGVRCGAECSEGHTYEPGSCEAAIDPDEAIARNHADAMRDWGIGEQGDGEGGGA